MDLTLTHPQYEVAIIGGGITGLSTAFSIQETARNTGLPVHFTLFESSSRLGGKILSEQTDGLVIEGGPDSVHLQKPWAVQLAQKLGLETELIGANPHEKRLYVVNHGRLTLMPDGVMMIIPTRFLPFVTSPLISWPGKIRMGMDLFIPPRTDDEDESLGNFIRRRLGSEALDKIAEPLMAGIHVSDPEQQSILSTFPRFRDIEKKYGSLTRGMLAQKRASQAKAKHAAPVDKTHWKNSAFATLKGGMGQLSEALEKALTEGTLRTACAVTSIQPLAGGGYQIQTHTGESLRADALVLTTPAYVSAELVAGFPPALSQALARLRYVSTATVSLAYRTAEVGENPLRGIGFLVPHSEDRRITACTMSSIKFSHRAPEGTVLLRCFVGGPGKEDLAERSDDAAIIADVRAELAALLGVRADPLLARVYHWEKGNAQYDVGHLERVREMHALCADQFPGLYLAGSALDGVGVPDCIYQGQQAAEKVFAHLHKQAGVLAGVA